jgi:putative salt-induced outer membrane protein YdiY
MKLRILFLLVGFCTFHISLAQVDSIIFRNNNYIVGEIKSLDKGVFIIETDYSGSDFKIEWSGVKEMYTETYFLITLTDGSRYNGRVKSTGENKITIHTNDGLEIEITQNELVFLKAVDSGFWSQFYASIDFGFNYAKSNNLQQLSIRSNLGYIAERWSTDLTFNSVNSTQDEVEPIKRTDIALTYRYFLPKDWYGIANLSFLSNTEQKLDLRSNGKIGLGKYLIHTNRKYWGFQAGVSFNNEKFSTETSSQQSLEGYVGTELNLFDIGDFSLLTNANAYPSITDEKRWKADFKIDAKYDLPLDFYLKAGFSLNYDNQPVEGATETDYVFQTTIGWEL